ncbi:MAG: PspC domain-containing protein [Candidatus Cyclobacteriaceae bacterium M2_1C_046]
MKKNISINISGIIFHIEEDGYERLKNYLDSIHRYFSSFDESSEIISDIEGRIAEIFLSKLSEGKQVITLEDVEALIATMGSVQDFKEAEAISAGTEESYSDEEYEETFHRETKKLYRDAKRKILGGVSAGIANYFKIDPLWIRLILILLAIGSYGIAIIAYVALWIFLPETYDIQEDQKTKKMYRNPQDKVIAGVSGGIAAYFGVDVMLIRLLFVIFTFIGGSGLIAYIILWIILPEANTLTDRMQMKGDPITLSNIEANIKKSLKVKPSEDENLLVKILLFPFRLLAAIFKGLGRALGPFLDFLVDFIRVAAGIILIIIGFSIVISLLITTGVLIGVWPAINETGIFVGLGDIGIPLEVIENSFPLFTGLAAFLVAAIPGALLLLLGISAIAKRIIFSTATGWTMTALFFISVIVMSVNVPAMIWNFQEEGNYQKVETYNFDGKIPVLQLREIGMDHYDVTNLRIRGHEGNEFKLVQDFEAQGATRKNAAENAQMVNYTVERNDSILIFDSNIQFKKEAKFRAQRLEMTLYVPYDSLFVMDPDLRHILRNTIYRSGYNTNDLRNNKWKFNQEGELICVTCPKEEDNSSDEEPENIEEETNESDTVVIIT